MSNANHAKIVQLYKQGLGCTTIGRRLNVSHRTVLNHLEKAGIKRLPASARRKYPINLAMLTDLSSEIGAYWFGFLLTDGSIYKTSKMNRISCRLGARDVNHLWKLSRDAGIIYGPRHVNTTIYNGKTYDQCFLHISSKALAEFYLDNGWANFKNGKIILPSNLNIRHFMRGLFDGDGIVTNCRTKLRIGFCSPHSRIIGWVRKTLCENLDINSNKIIRQVINYTYWNGSDALKIAAWLYTNQSRCLQRKSDRVMQYLVKEAERLIKS